MIRPLPRSPVFPYTTLFRSREGGLPHVPHGNGTAPVLHFAPGSPGRGEVRFPMRRRVTVARAISHVHLLAPLVVVAGLAACKKGDVRVERFTVGITKDSVSVLMEG